jgi:hypothetical protein
MIGCSGSEPKVTTFPVSGSVLIDKKPGEQAMVVFHPVGSTAKEAPKPRGKVQSDGSFHLTTYAENDGAPAGDYQVTVELWLAGRPDEGPVSKLPAKLAKAESSGLKATVKSETNQLTPFEISRR